MFAEDTLSTNPQDDSVLKKKPKLVVVAWRTDPPVRDKDEAGYLVTRSSGGMTVTMSAFKTPEILSQYDLTIVGVDPNPDKDAEAGSMKTVVDEMGVTNALVAVPPGLVKDAYDYGNQVAWWLEHNKVHLVNEKAGGSEAFQEANDIIAKAVTENIELTQDDQVHVHDTLVTRVPEYLKKRGCKAEIGYFLHTPFPSVDALEEASALGLCNKQNVQANFIDTLYAYPDKVSFQTCRDASKFTGNGLIPLDEGAFPVYKPRIAVSMVNNQLHSVQVTVAPVAPDVEGVRQIAKDYNGHPKVRSFVDRYAKDGEKVHILAGRVDPAKNHDGYFDGLEALLDEDPEALKGFNCAMFGPKTRSGLASYDKHYDNVMGKIASINEKAVIKGLKQPGENMVEYWGDIPRELLLGIYGTADELADAGASMSNVVLSGMDGYALTAAEGNAASKNVLLWGSNNIGAVYSLGGSNMVRSFHTNATEALKDTKLKETVDNLRVTLTTPRQDVLKMNERSMETLAQYTSSNWAESLLSPTVDRMQRQSQAPKTRL